MCFWGSGESGDSWVWVIPPQNEVWAHLDWPGQYEKGTGLVEKTRWVGASASICSWWSQLDSLALRQGPGRCCLLYSYSGVSRGFPAGLLPRPHLLPLRFLQLCPSRFLWNQKLVYQGERVMVPHYHSGPASSTVRK